MFLKLSAIAVFSCLFAFGAHAEAFSSRFVPARPVEPMPDISFDDGNGRILSLKDFRGHPLLLNMWATWCGPCAAEMPLLDVLQAELSGNGVLVLAISGEREGAIAVPAFFKRHEIRHLTVYTDGTGRLASVLRSRELPVTYFVDAQGNKLGWVEGGAEWASPEAEEFVRATLQLKH